MVALSTGLKELTAPQRELVNHWYECRAGARLPTRECLDPGAIRSHLAAISIVEVQPSGQVRFRLAGSGLRRILGREMRGRLVSELEKNLSDMWSLGLSSALEQGRPVGGMIQRESDGHAWLRLPLYSPRSGALVLCHDTLVQKSRLVPDEQAQSHTLSPSLNILAA